VKDGAKDNCQLNKVGTCGGEKQKDSGLWKVYLW